MRKIIPVTERVFGENDHITLGIRSAYASALCEDADATLDDFRKAVATLEETESIARRVLGGTHPTTVGIVRTLQSVRAELGARSRLSFEIDLPRALFLAFVVAKFLAWALEPFWQ